MPELPNTIAVVDFRRSRLILEWRARNGTWTACDDPPARMHGIALIRPNQDNVCLFAHEGELRLQIGTQQFALQESTPALSLTRPATGFGLRRTFAIEGEDGSELFSHSYWTHQGRDFFQWLAEKAQTPDWRAEAAQRWSNGVDAAELRSS